VCKKTKKGGSSMYNKITIIGNLTKDPEIKYGEKGAVGMMRIAVNTRVNEEIKETLFINVICFGNTAENATQYLNKGSKIFVEGRLRERQWEDQNGVKRNMYEIVANRIIFLDKKDGNDDEELINEPF
jgi:single-strand DNA-binding protein